jgi:hypothetical protein
MFKLETGFGNTAAPIGSRPLRTIPGLIQAGSRERHGPDMWPAAGARDPGITPRLSESVHPERQLHQATLHQLRQQVRTVLRKPPQPAPPVRRHMRDFQDQRGPSGELCIIRCGDPAQTRNAPGGDVRLVQEVSNLCVRVELRCAVLAAPANVPRMARARKGLVGQYLPADPAEVTRTITSGNPLRLARDSLKPDAHHRRPWARCGDLLDRLHR